MKTADVIASALRLLRSPRDLAIASVVLAIGVGSVAAAFAIVDTVLLRPLPYASPERLVRLWDSTGPPGVYVVSLDDIDTLNASKRLAVAGFASVTQTVATFSATVTVQGLHVTTELFDVLGVRPEDGRLFRPEDARLGSEPTVIVSSRLASMLALAIGDPVAIGGRSHRVVGITPDAFWFPDRGPAFWIPVVRVPPELLGTGSVALALQAVARLPDELTLDSAARTINDTLAADKGRPARLRAQALHSFVFGPLQTPLVLLQIGASLLALLTCLNAAWLFRAHAARHAKTFAVMMALGASIRGVVSVVLTEVVVVAAAVVPISLMVTRLLLSLAGRIENGVLTRFGPPGLDWRVAAATGVVALITTFGASMPALVTIMRRVSSVELLRARRIPGRSTIRFSISMAMQGSLAFAVAVQAVTLVLVLRAIFDANVGFRGTSLVGVEVKPGQGGEPPTLALQYQALVARMREAGLTGAVTSVAPLTGVDHLTSTRTPHRSPRDQTMVRVRAVSGSYFALAGVTLLAGNLPTSDDDRGEGLIVDPAFVARVLSGGPAVGQTVSLGDAAWQVRAVVGQVRHAGIFEEPQPTVYLLYGDVPRLASQTAAGVTRDAVILVQETGGVAATIDRVRRIVSSELPGSTITRTWRFSDLVWQATGERPLMTMGATAFAVIAIVLLAIGVNGMLLEYVESRRREIALRASLGASPRRIIGEMVAPVLAAGGIAVIAGGALTGALGRTILSLAFVPDGHVRVQGWIATLGSAAAMAAIAALAVWFPASRALQVNPADLLRLDE